MDMPAPGFKYRAFISYSHQDAAAADWVHKAVERYRVPRALVGRTTAMGVVPARLSPLFRDREELAASTDLSAVITAALEGASHLVVICSPRSARSKWVNEEIAAFKRLGREDRIFAIIVDGEPNSGDPERECFPEALRFRLGPDGRLGATPTEPVAADARDTGDGRDNAKLKLIAGLIGVGLDDLKRRELQAQRRRTAFAYGLTAVFALLALAAVWFAFSAEKQRSLADEQRLRAETGEKEAVSQRDRANAAVDAARRTAGTMVTQFTEELRTAPGAQVAVTADILEKAIGLLDILGESTPLGPKELYIQALGLIGLAQGDIRLSDFDAAIVQATRAIGILKDISTGKDAPPGADADLATAYDVTGNAYMASGRNGMALSAYGTALKLREALIAGSPDDRERKRDIEFSHRKIGEVSVRMSALASARVSLGTALAIAEELDPGWPQDDARYLVDLPDVLTMLGNLLEMMKDPGARPMLERAAQSLEGLFARFPNDTSVYSRLGTAWSNLAAHLQDAGDLQAASDIYVKALTVRENLHGLDADNVVWSQDLYRNYANLSSLSFDLKAYPAALYYVRRAITVLEAMVARNGEVAAWNDDLEVFRSWESDLVANGVTEQKP